MPPETKEVVQAAVAALGPDATPKDVTAEVRRRCAAGDLRTPSRSQIWNLLMAERQKGAAAASAAPGIALGRIWLKLPVTIEGEVVLPEALVAVRTETGAITALEVALAPARPRPEALLRQLERGDRAIAAAALETMRKYGPADVKHASE